MNATRSPAKRYATLAKALRESGLEVQDDDFELIDAVVSACNHLLNVRETVPGVRTLPFFVYLRRTLELGNDFHCPPASHVLLHRS